MSMLAVRFEGIRHFKLVVQLVLIVFVLHLEQKQVSGFCGSMS